MQFLKNHYEKILLSVVLLGLAGAAAWLPFKIGEARQGLSEIMQALPKPKGIKPVDLSTNLAVLEKLKTPMTPDFGPPQLVFNPVIWKQRSDGTLFKIETSNPADALKILKVTPLNLVIALEKIAVNGTNIGYTFAVTNQAAHRFPASKESSYMKIRDKNKYFVLKGVKGAPEDPEVLDIELLRDKQPLSVGKNKPVELLEGYAADMAYPIENKTFVDVRVGNSISFGGDKYKIIAITAEEVRVQADSNDKQTTIKLKTAQ